MGTSIIISIIERAIMGRRQPAVSIQQNEGQSSTARRCMTHMDMRLLGGTDSSDTVLLHRRVAMRLEMLLQFRDAPRFGCAVASRMRAGVRLSVRVEPNCDGRPPVPNVDRRSVPASGRSQASLRRELEARHTYRRHRLRGNEASSRLSSNAPGGCRAREASTAWLNRSAERVLSFYRYRRSGSRIVNPLSQFQGSGSSETSSASSPIKAPTQIAGSGNGFFLLRAFAF